MKNRFYLKLGIILGISVGACLLIISEVIKSKFDNLWIQICERQNCSYSSKSLEINFFQGSLTGYGITFKNLKSRVDIPKMEAKISYKALFDYKLFIENLNFYNSTINNLTNQSVLYTVIKDILTPSKKKHFYKIQLDQLIVKSAKLIQEIGSSELVARNVNFKLKDENTFIKMYSNLEKIILKLQNSEINLGRSIADFSANKKEFNLNNFILDGNLGHVKANFRSNGRLEGTLNSRLFVKTLLPNLDLNLESVGNISGILSNPEIKLKNYNLSNLKLFDTSFEVPDKTIQFDSFLNLNQFKIDNIGLGAESIQDAMISSDYKQILGSVDFSFQELEYNGIAIKDANINLGIAGNLTSPEFIVELFGNLEILGKHVSSLELKTNSESQIIDVKLGKSTLNYNLRKNKIDLNLDQLSIGGNYLDWKDQIIFKNDFKSSGKINNLPFNFIHKNKDFKLTLKQEESDFNLSFSDKNLKIETILKQFDLSKFIKTDFCTNLSGTINYSSDLSNIKFGDGIINIFDSSIGCANQKISLNDSKLLIKNGNIKLPLNLLKLSNLKTKGTLGINSNDLNITGNLDAQSLSFINSNLNTLDGKLNLNLQVKGSLLSPEFSGVVGLTDLDASFKNLDISEGNGKILLNNSQITFEDLSAKFNDGLLNIRGNVNLEDYQQSSFQFDFQDLVIEPEKNTNFQLSGNLKLTNFENNPKIIGDILVKNGRVTRNINFRDLTQNFLKNIFQADSKSINQLILPEIPLDVFITSNSSLFFSSNYLATELAGTINIQGTLNTPKLTGTLKIINGWMGVQDRKLYISSGDLKFTPNSFEPKIDIFADTSLVTYLGNPVNISLSLSGYASDPKLMLESDGGYTQAELLQLISSMGVPSGRTDFASAANLGEFDIISDSWIPFSGFLGKLTKIDSISIEPALNPRTGLTEPAFLAEKKLGEQLSLFGQSFISQNIADSRIILDYPFNKRLSVAGTLDNDTSQEVLSLGFDVKYSFLGTDANLAQIDVQGDTELSEYQVEKLLGITKRTKYSQAEIPQYISSIRYQLQNLGYFNSQIQAECLNDCKIVKFLIIDGESAKFNFEEVSDQDINKILDKYQKLNATKNNINALKAELLKYLRIQGWINSKVYLDSLENDLLLRIEKGKRYVIEFFGNNSLTLEDLFSRVGFYTQTTAFNSNFPEVFKEEFLNYYKQLGFYNIDIKVEQYDDINYTRIKYLISEGDVPEIQSIKFDSSEDIWKLISDDKKLISDLKTLEIISNVQLSNLTKRINQNLVQIGYDNNNVNYSIDKSDIIFKVDLKDKITSNWIEIDNSKFKHIIKPKAPYSIYKANQYLDTVLDYLSDQGYYSVSYSSVFNDDKLIIDIDYGNQAKVKSITIKGIPEEFTPLVLKKAELMVGYPVTRDSINQTKRKLINTGLFSKVDLKVLDDKIDSNEEDLIIIIEPKELNDLKVGTGVNSELGYHLFLEGSDRGLFKDGKALFLRANTYLKTDLSEITEGTAGIRYSDPDFNEMFPRMNLDARFQRLNQPSLAYDLDRRVIDSLFIKTFDRYKFDFGFSVSRDSLTSEDTELLSDTLDDFSLGLFSFGIIYDRRDNSLNPQDGYQIGLDIKASNAAMLGDISLIQGVAKASFITPINYSKFSFANNLRLGLINNYGSAELPVSARFFLGGRTSVRGFRENSLGNKTNLDNAFGGDRLFSNNMEIQYRMTNNLTSHVFIDSGYLSYESDSSNVKYSSGLGMSFISAVGPIGVDLGRPLNPGVDEDNWRLHFSLGSIF